VIVNLDPFQQQSGWTDLDLEELNLERDEAFQVEDLLSGEHYEWKGARNFVILQPGSKPAHILRIGRRH